MVRRGARLKTLLYAVHRIYSSLKVSLLISLQPCDAVQRAIVHSLFGLKGRESQQWLQGLEHFVRFSRWRAGAWSPPLKKWDMHFRWVLSPANRITLRSVAAGHRTTTTNDARRIKWRDCYG